MRVRWVTALTVCLFAALISAGAESAAAADDTSHAVMKHWVGDWTGEVAGGLQGSAAQVAAKPAQAHVVWTLDDQFIQGTNSDAAGKAFGIWMMHYDPKVDKYRVWFFAADGSTGEWKGTWSEAQSTMTWTGHDADGGMKLTGSTKFAGNRQEWKLDVEEDGKVTTHTGSLTRK